MKLKVRCLYKAILKNQQNWYQQMTINSLRCAQNDCSVSFSIAISVITQRHLYVLKIKTQSSQFST